MTSRLKAVRAKRVDGIGGDFVPLARYCVFLAALSSLYMVAGILDSRGIYTFVNWFGPAGLFVFSIFTCYKLLRRNPALIWTPLPWLLIAVAAYFGFGPLIYTFGSWSAVANVDAAWPVSTEDLFRTNLLTSVGMAVLSLAFFIVVRKPRGFERVSQAIQKSDERTVRLTAISFLCIGGVVKYGLSLPYEFGLTSFVLPGTVYQLEQLTLIVLILIAYLSISEGGKWKLALMFFLPTELLSDFLRFSKTSLLLAILMPFMGWYMAKKKIKILAAGAALMILVYVLLTPLVSWSRDTIGKMTGAFYRATLSQRLDVALEYFTRDASSAALEESDRSEAWWGRLDYVPEQVFAMREYDMGRPSHDFSQILWVFVPRVIWPDKPVMTQAGIDLSERMGGSRTTSVGTGLFADGYYNGGWTMVIIVCCVAGSIMAFLSRMALAIMEKRALLLLPCVFMGIQMGTRIDGRFVPDYLGASVIYMGYFVIVYFLFTKKQKKRGLPATAFYKQAHS